MSEDIFGLGIEGLGYGGFAADTYSTNGIQLNNTTTATTAAAGAIGTAASLNKDQRKKQVADIVELLEKQRSVHSFAAFFQLSSIDLNEPSNKQLRTDLSKNSKIQLDEVQQTISYKATLPDVRSRADILSKVNTHSLGIAEELFLDAYHGVEADIDTFVKQQELFRLRPSNNNNTDNQKNNDTNIPAASSSSASTSTAPKRKDAYSILLPRRRQLEVQMTPALQQLWHNVSVPVNPVDLDSLLLQHNLMSAKQMKRAQLAASAAARGELKRKKKGSNNNNQQRKRYRQHLTNTHLINQQGYSWLTNKPDTKTTTTAAATSATQTQQRQMC